MKIKLDGIEGAVALQVAIRSAIEVLEEKLKRTDLLCAPESKQTENAKAYFSQLSGDLVRAIAQLKSIKVDWR